MKKLIALVVLLNKEQHTLFGFRESTPESTFASILKGKTVIMEECFSGNRLLEKIAYAKAATFSDQSLSVEQNDDIQHHKGIWRAIAHSVDFEEGQEKEDDYVWVVLSEEAYNKACNTINFAKLYGVHSLEPDTQVFTFHK